MILTNEERATECNKTHWKAFIKCKECGASYYSISYGRPLCEAKCFNCQSENIEKRDAVTWKNTNEENPNGK